MSKQQENVQRIMCPLDMEIIDRMRAAGLADRDIGTAEFLLIGMFNEEIELLDILDDENSSKSLLSLMKLMQIRGLVSEDKDGPLNWKLTTGGTKLATFLLERCDQNIETQIHILDKETGEIVEQESSDLEKLAREVNAAFPPSNDLKRQLRNGYANALQKLTVFKANYSFPEDVILEAVKLYISEQEQSPEGHKFTRNSSNFIVNQEKTGKVTGSELSAWCEKVLEERKNPTNRYDSRALDTV